MNENKSVIEWIFNVGASFYTTREQRNNIAEEKTVYPDIIEEDEQHDVPTQV
jgi:hypothetical protein